MAHLIAVPPLPDVEDLFGLLRFLSDPEAVRVRVEQLEAYKVQLDAQLALIGTAEDWDVARTQARADRQMAKETLELAKAEAKKIIGTALEDRDAAVAEAARVRQTLQVERDALDRAVTQATKVAVDREAVLLKREEAATLTQAKADAMIRENAALKAELEARKARLQAAAAEA